MPQSLRTTTGQFSSSAGRAQARATNARAVEPALNLPGAERGNLYMLVEVTGTGGGHAALYRQILNAAQTAFYEASGSQSAALIRAVRSAHSVLVRANEGLPEAAWRAGVNFAVLQGNELTIAQAGPALAVVSHPKTVDQFPAQLGEDSAPLGGSERPEVKLFRTGIEAGDMLLLAESDWLKHVKPEALAVVATANSTSLAQDYLGQLAGDADLSALIVGFAPVSELAVDALAVAASSGAEAGTETGAASKDKAGKVALAAGIGAWFGRRRRTSESSAAAGPAAQASQEAVEPALAGIVSLSPKTQEPEEEPVAAIMHMEIEEAPAAAVVAASGEPEEMPRRSLWPLLVALVIIPVLIGALVFAMWWLRNPRAEVQFVETLDGATAVLDQIDQMSDQNLAVQRLPAAQELLDKARAMRPDDARLAAVEARYQALSDRIQQVEPLYGVVPLWDFNNEGQNLARVVGGGDSLYVLDKGSNAVYRLILSSLGDSAQLADQPVVVKKADQAGDRVVSDLLDMTWVEGSGNQRSKLAVLDTAGTLIGYDSTYGASSLPVGGQEQWQQPQLIMGYGGNLYILDSGANQIWRYRPGATGFEGEPEPYFASGSPTDLAGVQAMAIDGSVWLLFPDGRLLKFLVGEAQPFIPTGPPGTPQSPVDVVTPLEGDRLYVADAGSGRILEYAKDGPLIRQFSPREGDIFKDVRSIYVDEAAGALYVLTGNRLYKANLPEPTPEPTVTPAQ
jgi:hypothetical protein